MASQIPHSIALFDSLGVMACVFDSSSLEIEGCSVELGRVLGRERADLLVGRFVLDLFRPESFEEFHGFLRAETGTESVVCTLLSPGRVDQRVVVTSHCHADGSDLRTLLCAPVQDDRARIAALEASVETQTDRYHRLREFTDLVAHDLRNQLHVVVSSVDLIIAVEGATLGPGTLRRIDRIQGAGETMIGVLDGVTKYLRFEVGDYPMELTDINALVDSLVLAVPRPSDKRVHIRRSGDLPSLVCERQLIQELFHNIVGNAIKYSDKDPIEIEIGLGEGDENEKVIYIKDNGVGIDETDLDRVFAPFARADHQGLNDQGTGMGMALVQRIVERHGGRIWLESQVNEGTIVSFSLSEYP
jgi:signal transduction histidine kinase